MVSNDDTVTRLVRLEVKQETTDRDLAALRNELTTSVATIQANIRGIETTVISMRDLLNAHTVEESTRWKVIEGLRPFIVKGFLGLGAASVSVMVVTLIAISRGII